MKRTVEEHTDRLLLQKDIIEAPRSGLMICDLSQSECLTSQVSAWVIAYWTLQPELGNRP